MEQIVVRWVAGFRKNNPAEVDHHLFEKNKAITGGASYRCLNYKSCPAKLHFLEGGSRLIGAHNHPANPERVTVRTIIAKAKNSATSSRNSSTADIIQIAEADIAEANIDASYLGRTKSLKRRLTDAKVKKYGLQSWGESFGTLQIPANMTKTVWNDRFLLYDNEQSENRIIVFASDDAINELAFCDTWLLDGTFKTCPSMFSQLYTVHEIHRNSTAMPFVYAYLPGKSAGVYRELLNVIRRKIPNEPATIITDFESAAILACREIFPATVFSGCLFHLTQSIFRRVQQEPDVYQRYMTMDNDGKKVRVAIRSLGALAFLPAQEVSTAFLELRAQFGPLDPVRAIFSYFQDNYIGNTWNDVRYPTKFWNVLERFRSGVPRTKNAKEGWHYRFNAIHSRMHPSVPSSVQKLQMEENHWFQECQKNRAGIFNRRRAKYALIDERLGQIIATYEGKQVYTGYLDFLEAIQLCLHDFIKE